MAITIDDKNRTLAYGFKSGEQTIYYADKGAREAIKAGVNLVSVEALPTASAETTGKIYLVPASREGIASNVKAEYVTVIGGTAEAPTYSWEKIGDTELDLSGYSKVGHKHKVTAAGTNADSAVSFDKSDDKVLGADTTFKASDSAVSGSATVAGANQASAVTFEGGTDDKVLGVDTTFKAAASAVSFAAHTTDNALGEGTSFTNAESAVSGEAAAQAWEQKSGSANATATNGAVTTTIDSDGIVTFGLVQPTITVSDVTVTGENAKSNVSGTAAAQVITVGSEDKVAALTALGAGTAAAQAISIDSKDEVTAVTGIGTGTAAAQTWGQTSGTISGTAAAQAISIDSADEVTALTGLSNVVAAAQVFTGSEVESGTDYVPQA